MSLMATAYQRAGRPQDVERVTSKALAENPPEHLRAMLLVDEAARLASMGELERARETARQALRGGSRRGTGFDRCGSAHAGRSAVSARTAG